MRHKVFPLAALAAIVFLGIGSVGCDGPTGSVKEGEPSDTSSTDPLSVDPISTDRLVGAHYYPWYKAHPGHLDWTDDAIADPVLGEYASESERVINQHVKWAREHGIRWFSMSWWGPGEPTDQVIKDHFLEARLADSIRFSVLYETIGRFGSGGVDMSEPSNRSRLVEDLQYLWS